MTSVRPAKTADDNNFERCGMAATLAVCARPLVAEAKLSEVIFNAEAAAQR
jgi:hypothetical protein